MTPTFTFQHTIPAALSLLPAAMDTPAARAMLIAIALQESKLAHRRQVQGPARGYWQFEQVGVGGVLDHGASRAGARAVCASLDYQPTALDVYLALADNDVLACAFARLLLWTLPEALPTNPDEGWRQYLSAWRPGKPHLETWAAYWTTAWETVGEP